MRSVSLATALLGSLLVFCAATPGQTSYTRPSAYLGVYVADVTSDRAAALKMNDIQGAEVIRINEGSPAEKAGVREGDVILTYNGENVLGREQLGRLVGETPPDRRVKLQLWRNGKAQSINVLLAEAKGVPTPVAPNSLSMTDFPQPIIVWTNLALGLIYEPLDAQLAQYFGVPGGVLIRAVASNAAAEKAGLRAGDVITGIGTREIAAPNDLIAYLRSQQRPIRSIEIQYFRDHKRRTAAIPVNE